MTFYFFNHLKNIHKTKQKKKTFKAQIIYKNIDTK